MLEWNNDVIHQRYVSRGPVRFVTACLDWITKFIMFIEHFIKEKFNQILHICH